MKVINKFKLVFVALCVCAGSAFAQGKATIKARFNNMERSKVYFTFMEKNSESKEFPYRDGQIIEFDVDLDDVTMLKINTFVLAVVQPGDILEIEVDYNGKNYRDARFSGSSSESVLASQTLNTIRAERLQSKYKTNIPAALAIQTPADVFYTTTVKEWKKELSTLESVKDKLNAKVYNFVRSELDAIFLPNIITYPDNNKQPGYWTVLNDYQIRDDDASLYNHSYLGMLGTYMQYKLMKNAHEQGRTYKTPVDLKKGYDEIVSFYDGKLRDATLLVFLYSAMVNGNDFEIAEQLYNDYVANYNKNPRYKIMLSDIMK